MLIQETSLSWQDSLALLVSWNFKIVKNVFTPEVLILQQEQPPIVMKRFFEDGMSELYLWHMHSLMSVFDRINQVVERANNSVAEVLENMEIVHKMLVEAKNENLMSLTVNQL